MIRLGEKIIYRPEIEVPYICRDTLTGLWVQFFRYGQYKLIVLHKHNSLPSMRPYIPLAFVGGSLSLLLLSLFHYYFFSAFLVIMLTYFGLNIALSVLIAIQKRDLSLLGLPVVFCVLHFSYGTGELFGLKKLLTNWLRRVMA